MKHIIIAGASRSGKTTLALKFKKEGFVHYKMDTIKRGLDNNFYDGRISLWSDASPKFANLIERIIDEAKTDIILDEEWYVIDTCHLYPKDIAKIDLTNTLVVFLGYPNKTVYEKLKDIREYDPFNQWTRKKSDEVLINNSALDIEYSICAKLECEKVNIPFFDTGTNFNEAIEEAYKYLKSHM